jgi:hypothetical protein
MMDTSRLWARPRCHLSGPPHITRPGQLPCAYSRKFGAGALVCLVQHCRDDGVLWHSDRLIAASQPTPVSTPAGEADLFEAAQEVSQRRIPTFFDRFPPGLGPGGPRHPRLLPRTRSRGSYRYRGHSLLLGTLASVPVDGHFATASLPLRLPRLRGLASSRLHPLSMSASPPGRALSLRPRSWRRRLARRSPVLL